MNHHLGGRGANGFLGRLGIRQIAEEMRPLGPRLSLVPRETHDVTVRRQSLDERVPQQPG